MELIGIDEVGRGCWAGPLLVVAVRATNTLPSGLTDSKKLSKARRETLAYKLKDVCAVGEGWVTSSEIDELGLTAAMCLGVARALQAIEAHYNERIIIDGSYNYCSPEFGNVSCIVKADGSVPEVSAASIIAKVMRDAYMVDKSVEFPEYGFESHVGYGTSAHLSALKLHGLTDIHRKSFKPIQKLMSI